MDDANKVLVIRRKATLDTSTSIEGAPSKDVVVELAKKQLLDFLKLIVDYPTEVQVSIQQGDRTTIFKIDCTQRNLGKILGCKGRMITSLRNMILAITARHGFRSIIEVPYYAANTTEDESCKKKVVNDF
ncbi:KH domain-containing protein [Bdellovibrio svalbardensis]|uniref:KH domain-containing protein n=1 Tax=Bdellovibrio svalbardensis TaxID=2972972 RepID=A0ABT6DLQ9_9BACT|nr:KH domain-containing protein [Bdellovibrio svalbardensis]MDG0817812.1 KH domain-containing protein [Bdellovibrio svalbardensis]